MAASGFAGTDARHRGRGLDGHGDRLDEPDRGREVAVDQEPRGQRGASVAVGLEEADELDEPGLAVGAIGDGRGQPDRAARCASASAATWRPVGSYR